MSGYLRKSVAGSDSTEPAESLNQNIHKAQKKENESARRERLAEKQCDPCELQPDVQAPIHSPQNIQLLNVFSVSPISKLYNSHVSSVFDESQQVSVGRSYTGSNDHNLVSELHLKGISLDADTISISSNESDWDIREVGEQISDNIDTKKDESKDKYLNNFFNTLLTEKGDLPDEPKLPTSEEASCPLSKLENSRISVKTTAKAESVQLHSVEAALSQFNKTREGLNGAQTLSTLRGLENRARKNLSQSKLDILPMIQTRSTAYPEKIGITNVVQRRSTCVLDNQSKHENIGSEQSMKVFCCARDWLTYIYGTQLICSSTYAAGSSTSVSQPALGPRPHEDNDCSIKKVGNITANIVQTETTSPLELKAEDQLRLPFKKRCRSNDNFEERCGAQTYTLRESSGVGKGESQVKFSEERKSHSKEKDTRSETCDKSRELFGENQKKAQHSDNRLYSRKDKRKSIPVTSDSAQTSSNKFDSHIMEADAMIFENVPKSLSKPHISEPPTLVMSKLQSGKSRSDCNVSKVDQDENILNNDHYKLNPVINGETRKEENHYGASNTLESDSMKSPIQFQPKKLMTNSRHAGPESSGKICHFIFKVRDLTQDDCQVTTSFEEVVRNTHIEEENTSNSVNKNNKNDDELLNKSGENGCIYGNSISLACEEVVSEVREEPSSTSGVEEISGEFPLSSEINNEQHRQNLTLGDLELQNWKDQLSEIIAEYPSGMLNTSQSEDKEIALINQKDSSEEVIDLCLENYEDLLKPSYDEYKILLCNDGRDYTNHNEMPSSDNLTNDTTAENKQNNTSRTEFCCFLSWSASVCGEQSKCRCTCPNSGGNEKKICPDISQNSCIAESPLVKHARNAKKGTRSADRISGPLQKTRGNVCEKPNQKNSNSKEYNSGDGSRVGRRESKLVEINLKEKSDPLSGMKNSASHNRTRENKSDRNQNVQSTYMFQANKEKAGPVSSATMDDIQGLVRCNRSVSCVSPTVTENKKCISANPKKVIFSPLTEVCEYLQTKPSISVHQSDKATKQLKGVNQSTPVKKQDLNDRPSRKNSQNKHNQQPEEHELDLLDKSKLPAQKGSSLDKITQQLQRTERLHKVKLSENTLEVNKTSHDKLNMQHRDVLQLFPGKKDQICSQKEVAICTTITGKKMELQSKTCSTGSKIGPKSSKNVSDGASVVKQNIGCHCRQARKKGSRDSLHLSHHRKKHSGKKTQYTQVQSNVNKSNTGRRGARTRKGSSEPLQVYIKRVEQSLQSKTTFSGLFKDGSSLLKSNMVGSSLSKQDLKKYPKRQYNLHNVMARPKKQKRSYVPRQRSPGVCPPKLDMRTQDIHNADVHIQEVNEIQEMKSWQNTQGSTKKSVPLFNNREVFPNLETKAGSQFRKLDEQQTLSKAINTIVNKNTCSVVKQNSKVFNLLPVKKTAREIVPKDKPHSTDKMEKHITGGIKTRSRMRCEQDKSFFPIFYFDCQLKNSTAVQETKGDDVHEKSGQERVNRHKEIPEPPKRKSNSLGSEKVLSKRRKSEMSNRKGLTAEKKPICTEESVLDLELGAGSLLTHIGDGTVTSKHDVSVEVSKASQDTDQPPNNKIGRLSYPENKHESIQNLQNPHMEANTHGSVVSSHEIKAGSSPRPMLPSSSNQVEVEQDTNSMNDLPLHLEKVASPTPDRSRVCSMDRSTHKEQTQVRKCVIRLHRLPLTLERQFLSDNANVMGKVIEKPGAEQREK